MKVEPFDRATTKRASLLEVAGVGQAASAVQRVQEAAWVIAVAKGEAERSRVVAARRVTAAPPVATSGSLDSVVACIYAHESGIYSESSHPGSGSGAAQWIPSTWRAWSIRAGYYLRDAKGNAVLDERGNLQALYDLAYQAPGSVQEAVLRYTLTHGGAHNWDPAYGNDSCTVGFG